MTKLTEAWHIVLADGSYTCQSFWKAPDVMEEALRICVEKLCYIFVTLIQAA
jgi:hypothetical protein